MASVPRQRPGSSTSRETDNREPVNDESNLSSDIQCLGVGEW